jgi:hypothetical protein
MYILRDTGPTEALARASYLTCATQTTAWLTTVEEASYSAT